MQVFAIYAKLEINIIIHIILDLKNMLQVHIIVDLVQMTW